MLPFISNENWPKRGLAVPKQASVDSDGSEADSRAEGAASFLEML